MDAEPLPDDDGDDAGPGGLLRAAAELGRAVLGVILFTPRCSVGAVIRPS